MAPKNMPTAVSDGVYEFPYKKPEKVDKWVAIGHAIYDPNDHTVFGRTAKNWGGLLIFYTIFFSVLAAMFAICMYGLLASVSPDRPTYLLESSIIGTNPGLGYRPYAEDVDQSLIWYVANNRTNVASWTISLDNFLRDYRNTKRQAKGGENRITCSTGQVLPPGKVCDVDLDNFGPCTQENGYGYNQSSPCIFLKLNRIFNWIPAFYNDTADLPDIMDEDLKEHIANQTDKNIVWLSCYGESVADRESIGPVAYYPRQGFAGYYYPFTNSPGYVSPLVAVQFQRPQQKRLINIECRAWAKNIIYEKALQHRQGSVHFELMVD